LLRLIALESHRHSAIVIGEDLGTVQPEFRKRIADFGIAGMDVLWFQREGDAFLPPSRWRHDAVAMTSTHDLPTVAGWWTGADIATRGAIGLANDKTEAKQRAKDRATLWHAFQNSGVVDEDAPPPKDAAAAVDAAIASRCSRLPRWRSFRLKTCSVSPISRIFLERSMNTRTGGGGSTGRPTNFDTPQVRARLKALWER
jgi:4-alpha-glucanotransferase